jgi:hypothetical protein
LDISDTFSWSADERYFVYRLRHEGTVPNQAKATFDCDAFALEVVYLIP